MLRTLRPKPCEICGQQFAPFQTTQRVCGIRCAQKVAKVLRAKGKKELRERKAALKTIPDLIKIAQREFNAYIRERDKDKPCICCGRFAVGNYGAGHGWDCGHYRSTGSASHLRFNEDNAHRQLVVCNRHGAGRAVDYRIGLIARIGLERVEELETNNTPKKWEREKLIAIASKYRAKTKELKGLE